jgi:hypothetical protein
MCQKGEKCTKLTLPKLPNGRKMYQMTVRNIFQMAKEYSSKALQNLPKLGFWVRKYTIWQPCTSGKKCPRHFRSIRMFEKINFSTVLHFALIELKKMFYAAFQFPDVFKLGGGNLLPSQSKALFHTRVARFLKVQHMYQNWGKIYQTTIKYPKRP